MEHKPRLDNRANDESHNQDNSVELSKTKISGKKTRRSIIQTDISHNSETPNNKIGWFN